MRVYKKLTQDFTVISNEILRHGLSYKAIGIYLYIVSKPDGWRFSLEGTASQAKDGIDSVRAGVKELKDAGFLKIERERSEQGILGESVWIVSDKPLLENPTKKQGKPLEKPTLENPMLVKPTLVNPRQVNTKEVNTEEVSTKNSTTLNGAVAPAGGIKKDNSLLNGHHLGGSSGSGRGKQAGYGHPDVSAIIDYLMEKAGLPVLNGTKADNRRYAWLALKKFQTVDKCKLIIDAAMRDKFWHTKLVSTKDLYYNGVKVISETRNVQGRTIHVDE